MEGEKEFVTFRGKKCRIGHELSISRADFDEPSRVNLRSGRVIAA